jgi:hypothetical protein
VVSLGGALAADILTALVHEDGAPRSVLLWIDPDGQFTRLRDAMATELDANAARLLALGPGGSQFEVKLALLDIEGAGGKAVVHLPGRVGSDLDAAPDGRPPALWAFVEYRFKGAIWGQGADSREVNPPTLDEWLIRQGVRFSGGGARAAVTAGGPDSRLARFAAKHAHSELAQFPQPVNMQTLNVVGEPRDLMIELLLDAEGAVRQWGEETGDARDLARSSFGVEFGGDDPAAWAEQLAMHLAVLEAWDALGRAPDYPFAARIPAQDNQREAGLALVRNAILPRSDVTDRLRALVNRHAAELGGLVAWAVGRAGLPAAIPAIAKRRLSDLIAAVDAAEAAGVAAGVAALVERLPPVDRAPAIDSRFGVLRDVRDLALLCQRERASSMAGGRCVPGDRGRLPGRCLDGPDSTPRWSGVRSVRRRHEPTVHRFRGANVDVAAGWPPLGGRTRWRALVRTPEGEVPSSDHRGGRSAPRHRAAALRTTRPGRAS